jgi:hypothetical protein
LTIIVSGSGLEGISASKLAKGGSNAALMQRSASSQLWLQRARNETDDNSTYFQS